MLHMKINIINNKNKKNRKMKIEKTIIFVGDNKKVAESYCNKLKGIPTHLKCFSRLVDAEEYVMKYSQNIGIIITGLVFQGMKHTDSGYVGMDAGINFYNKIKMIHAHIRFMILTDRSAIETTRIQEFGMVLKKNQDLFLEKNNTKPLSLSQTVLKVLG